MNKQSNIQDKISEVEKGCGSKEYCFICEKYNCNCESSECFKTCGNSENVFRRIELCPECQAKRQIWKEAQEIMNERETETKFTKEQLKEIEKIFDIQASLLSSSYAQVFNSIARLDDSKDMLNKLLNEFTFAFDMYRTISAKADIMQNECEDEK